MLLAYAAPGAAASLVLLPLLTYLPARLVDGVGLAPAAVAAILLAARLWDALVDPLAGYLGDRTRTRHGRRRPWLAASGLALAVLAPLTFQLPAGTPAWLVALAVAALYSAWGAYQVTYLAWGAELDPSPTGRLTLSTAREAAGMLGFLAATAGPLALAGTVSLGTAEALALVAVLCLVGVPAATAAALTLPEPPPAPPPPGTGPRRAAAALAGDPPFRRLLAGTALAVAGTGAFEGTIVLNIDHALGLPGSTPALVAAMFVSALALSPATLWLGRRFGPARVLAAAVLVQAAGALLVWQLPTGRWEPAAAAFVLLGAAASATRILPYALVAGAADRAAARGQGDWQGVHAAVFVFTAKAAFAVGGALGFLAAGWSGLGPGGAGGAEAVGAFRMACALLPAALLCAAAPLLAARPGPAPRRG